MRDLSSIEGLRRACKEIEDRSEWHEKILELLKKVKDASLEERRSEEFHRLIWYENSISGVGFGDINVDQVISHMEFRSWLAEESMKPLPDEPQARSDALERIRSDLVERVRESGVNMRPLAMATRLLAALFPRDFTTLVADGLLPKLLEKMDIRPAQNVVGRHRQILDKLEEALGPVPDGDLEELTHRMTLPWLLNLSHTRGTSEGNLSCARGTSEGKTAPKNIILYGPPGTGKTYATARRCVEICDGSAERSDEEIRRRYNELVKSGRVEFITFHQSYGYEEFVEGLRPKPDGTGFRLVATDGVLKRIAKRAKDPEPFDFTGRQIFKMSLGKAKSELEQKLFDECIRNDYVLINWCPYVDWSDPCYEDEWEIESRCQYEKLSADSAKVIHFFRNTLKRGDIIIGSKGSEQFHAIGEVTGPYEFMQRENKKYPHRRAVRWHWSNTNGRPVSEILRGDISAPSFYKFYEFIELIEDVQCESLLSYLPHPQPHVLVIDEINRANISKVMGELITLLEEDKREGEAHEVAVTLPHSQEQFTLPSSLYILGTMNTADRSIALLDTALRRRFEFEELVPRPDLLGDVEGINMQKLLRAMNDRLEWLVDRDHLIGHAWLMGAETKTDVDCIMQRKIIPLIAEYFYDDWEKVRAVLGGTNDFVKKEELSLPPGIEDAGEARYRWTVQKEFTAEAYDRLVKGTQ